MNINLVKIFGRIALREIQASQAKTHLTQLLDEVERGETVVITRHGATGSFLRWLSRLPIVIDALPEEARLLDLSRRYRLTVYDAAYLEVADRLGVPLATTDGALAKAARNAGVALLGP